MTHFLTKETLSVLLEKAFGFLFIADRGNHRTDSVPRSGSAVVVTCMRILGNFKVELFLNLNGPNPYESVGNFYHFRLHQFLE